ncbi:nucleotidyltransferase domain-containing protein [Kribbella lupini]|uniref:Polymerase nucleotidyl transferase domain-containing protein n=1 Tax=Kribbella lupini TaxID=291602 RepID=A0ABN2CAN5_9ACTN
MNRDVLLDWVTEQLRQDHRVRGLWITGSTARGTADAFSDLDLVAVVGDEDPKRPDGSDSHRAGPAFVSSWLDAVRQALPLIYHQVLEFGPTIVVNHVVAASGSTLLRTMLVQLMVESVEVEDRGGALHLSALLDPEHYRTIEALPPIVATRESAVEVHRACVDAFFPLAEDLCRRTGVTWPDDFATAV